MPDGRQSRVTLSILVPVRNTMGVTTVRWSMHPRRALALFLPSVVLATALCGLVYVVAQNGLRTGANDPQEQLARDAATRLDGGAAPATVIGSTTVDVAADLAPFIIVHDATGNVLATDGVLDGKAPMLPDGVLASATQTGLDAVTWQPRTGVRVATITVPWNGGTVTSGRSLRLVEDRESALELIVAAAWIATVLALAVACTVAGWLWPQPSGSGTRPAA